MTKKATDEFKSPLADDEDGEGMAPLSIFDICETDTQAEENGKWFKDIFKDESNIDLKLRRLTSKESVKVRRRLDKQFKGKQQRDGTYDDDTATAIMVKQMAHAVIVDWTNIRDRDRTEIPFSPEAAEKLMTLLPTFRDVVLVYANDMDNFRITASDEVEKN